MDWVNLYVGGGRGPSYPSLQGDTNTEDWVNSELLYNELEKDVCDWAMVLRLIDKGADTVLKTKRGRTALHLAVMRDDCELDIIKKILCSVTDINYENGSRRTVLHYALQNQNCNFDIVHELLDMGADPNSKGPYGLTPLHIALERDDCELDIIKRIINSVTDINAKTDNDRTALHYALGNKNCNLDIVQELLDMGAHPNSEDDYGETLLHLAVKRDDCELDIIKIFIGSVTDINAETYRGETVLHNALNKKDCKWDIVSELILAGADIYTEHEIDGTPVSKMLNHPSFNLNLDAIKYLLKSKSRMDKMYAQFFHSAIKSNSRPRNLKCIFWLVKNMFLGSFNEVSCDIDEVQMYVIECRTEILRMKSQSLGTFSLFSWLTDALLSLHFKENEMHCVFQSLVSNSYPIYKDIILAKMPKTYLVNKLVELPIYSSNRVNNSQQTSKVTLLPDCIHALTAYLSNEDVFSLFMAFFVSDNKKRSSSTSLPPKRQRVK